MIRSASFRQRLGGLRGVVPDINVTPLVDVVLVLLIIFMVIAPQLDQDVPVDLPGMFNPDPDSKTVFDPIQVTVAKQGEFYIDKMRYDLNGAVQYLSQMHAAEPMRRLVLRADAKLGYVAIRDLFAQCQQIGFPGLSLLVGERNQNAEAAAS